MKARTFRKVVVYAALSLLVLAAPFGILLPSEPAEATHLGTSPRPGGRYMGHGYFNGGSIGSATLTNNTDVIQNGIEDNIEGSQAVRKANFIASIKGKLSGGAARDRMGAAFVIQTMRGSPWSRNNPPTAAEIADWEARINHSNICIIRSGTNSYTVNSGYFSSINDDAFLEYPGVNRLIFEFRTRPSTGCSSTGGTVLYELKQDCANPVGFLPGLPDVSTPANIEPRIWVNNVQANATLDATAGSVEFYHRINTSSYGGQNHTVTARVDQYISTNESCSSGGTWTHVETRTITITGDGHRTITPRHDVSWDPNVHRRICERLTITNAGGANTPNGTTLTRYANIRSGNISVISNGTPSEAEPGQSFSMSGSITASPGTGTGGFDMTYSISYTSNVSGLSPPPSQSGTVRVDGPTSIENPFAGTIPASATPGSTICVTTRVTSPSQSQYPNYFATSDNETFCLRVVAKPIVSVFGGDAAAGAGFAPTCAAVSDAAIAGWNTNTGAYDGAGTQFGAFALGKITGFASAKINATGATPPRSLAFANTPASSGEEYGGEFGSLPCITDHFGLMPANVQVLPALASIGPGTQTGAYLANNAINIPATTLPGGNNARQIVVYVEGDVYISGNLAYNRSGTWSTPAHIPGLKLVVRGDIYIRNTVTQLNGIYIAQGDGTNGGNIYTCATAPGNAVNTGNTSSSSLYGTCNTPLTVNGTFVAHKIYFTRTFGTAFNNVPAERFNYLPELWLTQWPDTSENNATKYDAITGLPPIL